MRVALLAAALLVSPSIPLAAQSDVPPVRKEVIYIEPTADDYAGMIVAASAWAKSTAKSVGVLRQPDASQAWQRGVAAAAKEHGVKLVEMNDFTMVCYTRQATRSTPRSQVCSMKGVDVVLQFSGLRIAGDSGAMVATLTRVPRNMSMTETTHHCLVVARDGGAAWRTLRSEPVPDPDRCIGSGDVTPQPGAIPLTRVGEPARGN